MIHAHNPLLTPTMRSAIRACEMAEATPGCLVRVTMTGLEQAEVIFFVSSYLSNRGMCDVDKTVSNAVKMDMTSLATVELNNGSGIEFVIEEPRTKRGKVRS